MISDPDELLIAMELIESEWGPNAFRQQLPEMRALWQANRQRAKWLMVRKDHIEELDGPLVEPPLRFPTPTSVDSDDEVHHD